MVGPIILLVDDNEDDVFIMERAFRQSGLAGIMHVVTNGDDAVRYLSGEGGFADRNRFPFPQLVFLDLKMPGKDGFDVLSWLQGQPGLKLTVAVLSSSLEERDMRRARELGADCYLIKPPTTSMLLSCWNQFDLARNN